MDDHSSSASPPASPWVPLGILGGVLLFSVLATATAGFVADDVGLGLNTVAFTEDIDGRRISGPFRDVPLVRETFAAYRAEGRPVVLWLGASQLYAINDPEPSDRLAVAFAQDAAAARGSDSAYVMTASPNSNLHEILCMLLAYRQRGLRPDALVISFTYDDLKEPGIRDTALELLELPFDDETKALCGPAAAHITRAAAAEQDADADAAPIERTATTGTPQERLEDELLDFLDARWPAYTHRATLRSRAITAWKTPVTRLAFSVLERPKQLVPDDMRAWNETAFDALLALAAADGVPVFVYKAPHRPDARVFFHDRQAYDDCHAELRDRVRGDGAEWNDFETLVPTELWGRTNEGAPDVFHFRVEGHRLLGRAVDAWLADHGY